MYRIATAPASDAKEGLKTMGSDTLIHGISHSLSLSFAKNLPTKYASLRFRNPKWMCLGVEDKVIQVENIWVAEREVKVLECLGHPEALRAHKTKISILNFKIKFTQFV